MMGIISSASSLAILIAFWWENKWPLTEKVCAYLYGHEVTVVTDHSAVRADSQFE